MLDFILFIWDSKVIIYQLNWKYVRNISDMVYYNSRKEAVKTRFGDESFGECIPINGYPPQTLVFNDISVSIDGKPILECVYGKAEPGEVLVILGPSGSGKTTVLNCFAGLQPVEKGVIAMNGEVLNKDLRRRISYVQQQDIFFSGLTLGQTLEYHAELKLPSTMTYQEKMKTVDTLVKIFNMNDPQLLQTKMGDVLEKGLSGGEMKRANIICELLTNASMILLDEPTTGLDSHNALKVVKVLKTIALKQNKTVIMTVHQPSSNMLQYFDKFLVVTNGEVAYFGNGSGMIETFTNLELSMDLHYNPADFIIDQLYTENRSKLIEAARKVYEQESTVAQNPIYPSMILGNGNSEDPTLQMNVLVPEGNATTKTAIESGQDSGRSSMFSSTGNSSLSASHEDNLNIDKWPISTWEQIKILSKRNFKNSASRVITKLNMIHTILLSVVVAALWFQIKRTEENLPSIKGFLFFTTFQWSLHGAFDALGAFPAERTVVNRERASGMYRLSAYYLAKIVSELLIIIVHPTVFHTITFLSFGFQNLASFFGQWFILLLSSLIAQSVGMLISSISYDIETGIVVCSLVYMPSILLGNFFVTSVPNWISYLQYSSPVFYSYDATQIMHFTYGNPVSCAARNSQYDECRYRNATSIPSSDIHHGEDNSLWINIAILCIGIIIIRVLTYLALRFIKSPTRTAKKLK